MGSQREWWLLKYAETGRSPNQQGEKKRGGKKEKEDPVRQACLGVSFLYMETCVKLGRNIPMTSSCSAAAAGHRFYAKVHVNVPADRSAPGLRNAQLLSFCCISVLSKFAAVIVSTHSLKDSRV